jgi:hypothetical protein
MSVQGDNFRNLAEALDNSSEAVRRMAETAKAAALGGLSTEKKGKLIEGLGAATSDAARIDAVQQIHDDCVSARDRWIAELEASGAADLIDTGSLNGEISLLQGLLGALQALQTLEILRDNFRGIASGFD